MSTPDDKKAKERELQAQKKFLDDFREFIQNKIDKKIPIEADDSGINYNVILQQLESQKISNQIQIADHLKRLYVAKEDGNEQMTADLRTKLKAGLKVIGIEQNVDFANRFEEVMRNYQRQLEKIPNSPEFARKAKQEQLNENKFLENSDAVTARNIGNQLIDTLKEKKEKHDASKVKEEGLFVGYKRNKNQHLLDKNKTIDQIIKEINNIGNSEPEQYRKNLTRIINNYIDNKVKGAVLGSGTLTELTNTRDYLKTTKPSTGPSN